LPNKIHDGVGAARIRGKFVNPRDNNSKFGTALDDIAKNSDIKVRLMSNKTILFPRSKEKDSDGGRATVPEAKAHRREAQGMIIASPILISLHQ